MTDKTPEEILSNIAKRINEEAAKMTNDAMKSGFVTDQLVYAGLRVALGRIAQIIEEELADIAGDG